VLGWRSLLRLQSRRCADRCGFRCLGLAAAAAAPERAQQLALFACGRLTLALAPPRCAARAMLHFFNCVALTFAPYFILYQPL
jgi:hypothetical protein